jgi:hypothetical protein
MGALRAEDGLPASPWRKAFGYVEARLKGLYEVGPLLVIWGDHGIILCWRSVVKWEWRW